MLSLVAVLCLTALAVPLVQFGGGPLRFGGVDFKAYYLAGRRVLAGYPLYADGPLVHVVPRPRATAFLYPPVVVAPFAALATLPSLPARAAWVAAQLAFLWVSVLALARSFGLAPTRGEALLAFVALVGFQPVLFLARIGNVSGAMAGLFCLSAAVTVAPEGPDRPYLGGAAAVLGVVPKPFAAPALAGLLGDRRRLLGGALALLALAVVSVAAFGPATHRTYLAVLLAGKGWGPAGDPTALPLHFRPFYRVPAADALRGVHLGAALGLSLVAARVGADARAVALGSLAVPLVAPTANTLTLVLALPGLLVALALEAREGGVPWLPALALVGVHGSVPLSRLVVRFGPNGAPALPWGAVERLLVVQPATVALAAAFWLCGYRILRDL
ncbi:glycosyltransferase family 87 protein [Halosegnis marinus]|uniref:glycosyltransferase family 87 protein n=1 Tax=Halosegnis marinus TaxID=3034023 RepID=UPI003610761C